MLVVGLALVSVGFTVAGPKLLGNATNVLFDGVVGKQLPAGLTKEQVVAGLRARGDDPRPTCVAAMDVVPGRRRRLRPARRGRSAVVVAASTC